MNKALKGGLSEPRFDIGATKFRIVKLGPEEALEVTEEIRPQILQQMRGMKLSMDVLQDLLGTIVILLVGLPKPTMAYLRQTLFEYVYFTNAEFQTETPLANDIGGAFKDLDVIHIYEVLARAFFVNFSGSLPALMLRLEALGLAQKPPGTETSSPSSPTS